MEVNRNMRLLLVTAVILVLAFVLFGAEALDEVANVIVQILQVVFELLVRFMNLFVELLKSMG
jgi:hypothetical protein